MRWLMGWVGFGRIEWIGRDYLSALGCINSGINWYSRVVVETEGQ